MIFHVNGWVIADNSVILRANNARGAPDNYGPGGTIERPGATRHTTNCDPVAGTGATAGLDTLQQNVINHALSPVADYSYAAMNTAAPPGLLPASVAVMRDVAVPDEGP